MRISYFKPLRRFDFNPHPFDIGNPFGNWYGHYDHHFLKVLYKRNENEYPEFYNRHLNYFLEQNPTKTPFDFFEHVSHIVKDGLEQLVKEDKNDSRHEANMNRKTALRSFQKYLKSIDEWNHDKTKDEVIADQGTEIIKLKAELANLKKELKEARKLETPDYINIADGYRDTLFDLILQIQELQLPEGKELVLSQTQAAWTKMLCKYFREGDKELNLDTTRRYFPSDKKEPGVKHAVIQSKHKLFQIKMAPKRSQS
ncbi:MAG: hypothetical protein ACHQIM_08235 [Sphingobacteriales bacterium]